MFQGLLLCYLYSPREFQRNALFSIRQGRAERPLCVAPMVQRFTKMGSSHGDPLKLFSPAIVGCFHHYSVTVPVGLSPGQILAVIAAFLMFALAIGLCLFGLRARIIRVLQWTGSVLTRCIRRIRDFPCQDPVLQFCRYYQNRHAPVATPRSPPMMTEYIFLDANELYVPSAFRVRCGKRISCFVGSTYRR